MVSIVFSGYFVYCVFNFRNDIFMEVEDYFLSASFRWLRVYSVILLRSLVFLVMSSVSSSLICLYSVVKVSNVSFIKSNSSISCRCVSSIFLSLSAKGGGAFHFSCLFMAWLLGELVILLSEFPLPAEQVSFESRHSQELDQVRTELIGEQAHLEGQSIRRVSCSRGLLTKRK